MNVLPSTLKSLSSSARSPQRSNNLEANNGLLHFAAQDQDLVIHKQNPTRISQLPNEILCEIFAWLTAGQSSDANPIDRRCYYISHVCHRWRVVALDDASLWTRISCDQGVWAMEMLKRSRQLLVDIEVSGEQAPKKVVELLPQVLTEALHRTRVIRLTGITPDIMLQYFNTTYGSAHALQTLELKVISIMSECSLPEGLFNEDTPSLRRIELFRCNIGWSSALFRHLYHLTLCNSPFITFDRPSTSQILRILLRLPRLQTLRLEYVLPEVHSPPTLDGSMTVTLSCLTMLRVCGLVFEVAAFVGMLVIPPHTSVALVIEDNVDNERNFSQLGKALALANGGYRYNPIRDLSIEADTHKCVRIRGQLYSNTCPPGQFPSYSHNDQADLALHLTWSSSTFLPWTAYEAVASALKYIRLDDAQSVRIWDLWTVDGAMWRQIFKRSHQISSVHVAGEAFYGLLQSLTPDHDCAHGPGPPLMPSLEKFHISRVSLHEDVAGNLEDCLIERSYSGSAIRVLEISKCDSLDIEIVDCLRKHVSSVNWDGMEDGPLSLDGCSDCHSCYGSGYWSSNSSDLGASDV